MINEKKVKGNEIKFNKCVFKQTLEQLHSFKMRRIFHSQTLYYQ